MQGKNHGRQEAEKPTILFIAVIDPGYGHFLVEDYGGKRIIDVLPHKQAVLSLVAWLRENGCEGYYVWVDLDKAYSEEGLSKINKAVADYKPDVLGFSLCTEELMVHYRLIELLKERHPDLPVVVGGPHVTAIPEDTIQKFPLIDGVIVGEGEITLTELVRGLASGKSKAELHEIKGIAFRDDDGKAVVTSPREKIPDLNILPDPAYDLIFTPGGHQPYETAFSLVCSYECYFRCTFCALAGGDYRYLKPERVADRIESAQEQFGAEYFAIRDSFWPPNREWLDAFCDEIERRGLKIQFHFLTRVGTLTEKQLERLRHIGARAIALGVEAGDPEILKKTKKGITLDTVRQTFKALNKVGIFSAAFFLFGNQGENRDTVQASIDFSHELNASMTFYNVLSTFPGSEAYGYVPDDEKYWWKDGKPYPSICDLPTEELIRLAQDATRRYPLRWAYLTHNVLGGKLAPEFKGICRRLFLVHMRRYILGVSERFWPTRNLVRGLKAVLRR